MRPYADADVDRVAHAVRSGKLVAYPTETFYALGVDPGSASALKRLSEVKGREPDKPFLLIVGSLVEVREWVDRVPPALDLIAEQFWPGPLTVVLPAREGLHESLLSSAGTIALRFSPHPAARALINRCGGALTGTSANRAGTPPACTAAQVRESFGVDEVAEILDGGETAGGRPSTLLDLSADHGRILRAGAISEERIMEVLRLL